MITEEELESENLSKRVEIGEKILDSSIKNLELYMNDKTKVLNSSNSKALYDLVVEWRELVQVARDKLSNPLAIKAISYWKLKLYPKLKIYDNLIIKWNRCHIYKLKTIEERVGRPLIEEVI